MLIGGDIAQWSLNGTDRWHTGMMAGYGHNNNSTNALSTGYHSEGRMNGYTAGLYATWYANDETHNGSYLDSWLQYSWFDNHINGETGCLLSHGSQKGLRYLWKQDIHGRLESLPTITREVMNGMFSRSFRLSG
ncbi:autotransporter outer membrane beta-barrel domain-containing protein [Escherichia coli]|nr:autotransporter outer membrane beta-barrel domain-containing protein [Escherichia coli]